MVIIRMIIRSSSCNCLPIKIMRNMYFFFYSLCAILFYRSGLVLIQSIRFWIKNCC